MGGDVRGSEGVYNHMTGDERGSVTRGYSSLP